MIGWNSGHFLVSGPRQQKKFQRLMLHRIKWGETGRKKKAADDGGRFIHHSYTPLSSPKPVIRFASPCPHLPLSAFPLQPQWFVKNPYKTISVWSNRQLTRSTLSQPFVTDHPSPSLGPIYFCPNIVAVYHYSFITPIIVRPRLMTANKDCRTSLLFMKLESCCRR